MNGFSNREENDAYRIVSLMIQSMFPPIKVHSMNLNQFKRVVLFNLVTDEEGKEVVEFRHYGLSARQRGVNKSIKRLVNNKKVPNLSKYNDIADYIYSKGGGYSSESEIDDLPGSKVILPDDFQDKKKDTSVAIKLHELGPRLRLKLVKIEEGVCRGNVVVHTYIQKSKKEIKEQMDELKKKRESKAERKRIQEENVKKKEELSGGKKKRVGFKGEEDAEEEEYGAVEVDESKDQRAQPKKDYRGTKKLLGKRKKQ